MAAKKRGFPYFYTILALLLLIGIIAVAYGLTLLNRWMADYEASQPKYVAERMFREYFADPDYAELLRLTGGQHSEFETYDDLVRYVSDQIGSGETEYRGVTGDLSGETLKYVVSAGDVRFAQFTVVKSDEVTEFGNPIYSYGDIQLFYMTDTVSVTVTAPAGATVYINGIALDSGDLVSSAETESCLHMPDGVTGLVMNTYTVSGLLYDPEVEVTDRDGIACELTRGEDGAYTAAVNYSEELKNEYADMIIDFTEKYAAYTAANLRFSAFSARLDKSSELYEQIRTLATNTVFANDGYKFVNQTAEEFYMYDEGVFSCHVKLTQILWRANRDDYYVYVDIVFYLHEINGEYLIYSMDVQ